MTYLSLYFLLLLSVGAFAQVNLVENGSFRNVATATRAKKDPAFKLMPGNQVGLFTIDSVRISFYDTILLRFI